MFGNLEFPREHPEYPEYPNYPQQPTGGGTPTPTPTPIPTTTPMPTLTQTPAPLWLQGTWGWTQGNRRLVITADGHVTLHNQGVTSSGVYGGGLILLDGNLSDVTQNGSAIQTYNRTSGEISNYVPYVATPQIPVPTTQIPVKQNADTACTMEARMCADGTSVGRNPANGCAFDDCPSGTSGGGAVTDQTNWQVIGLGVAALAALFLVTRK